MKKVYSHIVKMKMLEWHSEVHLLIVLAAVIAGVVVYFSLPFELPALGTAIAFITVLSFYSLIRSEVFYKKYIALLCVFVGGIFFAQVHTHYNSPFLIETSTYGKSVEVVIESVKIKSENFSKVLVRLKSAVGKIPEGSRFNLIYRRKGEIVPGTTAIIDAVFEPLPGPILPSGYDNRLQSFFSGISGGGFVTSGIEVLSETDNLDTKLEIIRHSLSGMLKNTIKGQAGALADALVTGNKSGLSEQTKSSMRDAGLAHLLAISGLHMTLVVLIVLVFVDTFILFLRPYGDPVRRRSIAAITAFAIASLYLLLSGAAISTQRAYVMVAIAMLALISGRIVLSVRSLTFAAFAIILLNPSAIMSAGFHMSFAATIMLVLAFERIGERPSQVRSVKNITGKSAIAKYILGSLWITALTQVAIMPFALYHFQSISVVAFLANLVAIPLMTFIIMPLLLIISILAAVSDVGFIGGLVEWPLVALINFSAELAQLPMATFKIMSPPSSALIAAIIILFLSWGIKPVAHFGRQSTVRGVWLISMGILACMVIYIVPNQQPLVIIDGARPTVALAFNGDFYSYGLRRKSFAASNWQSMYGLNRTKEGIHKKLKKACDSEGCITALPNGLFIAHPKSYLALVKDCQSADIIISPRDLMDEIDATSHCKGQGLLVLGEEEVDKYGPAAVYTNKEGNNLTYLVSKQQASRPWHPGYERLLSTNK